MFLSFLLIFVDSHHGFRVNNVELGSNIAESKSNFTDFEVEAEESIEMQEIEYHFEKEHVTATFRSNSREIEQHDLIDIVDPVTSITVRYEY
jgi:hypothetical protein